MVAVSLMVTPSPTKTPSFMRVKPSGGFWSYAFRDIAPQAPTHILVVPKSHIDSCNGITAENSAVAAHIFEVIPRIAAAENLTNGYRVVSNCGDDGCQSVHHLHFHILGGRKLSEQMA